MFSLEKLDIDLLSMQGDSEERSIMLDDDYFSALDDAEIQHGSITATMSIRKASTGEYALVLCIDGSVTVQCDRCLDDMEQPVKGEISYIVKLGETPSEEENDTIVVDENEGILSTAWLFYETIALAVPIRHVHAPGKCNCAMTKKLEELSATRSGDEAASDAIDPRWEALKELKSKK